MTRKQSHVSYEKGKNDRFATFETSIKQMRDFLEAQRQAGEKLHLTFEISGQAAYRYDRLCDLVDEITVSNPSKMTWIYRTAKKNDRVDARKQAVLLSIGEVPKVHIPSKQVRQWRVTIQHRRKTVNKIVAVKNRIRALLKANGFSKTAYGGSWWNMWNPSWMRGLAEQGDVRNTEPWRMNLMHLPEQLEPLGNQLNGTTKYLDDYLKSQPGAKVLLSIPGVG